MSVDLEARKPLRKKVSTGNRNAKRINAALVIIMYPIDSKDGERGRNRTYNLLIKSQQEKSIKSQLSHSFSITCYVNIFALCRKTCRNFLRARSAVQSISVFALMLREQYLPQGVDIASRF